MKGIKQQDHPDTDVAEREDQKLQRLNHIQNMECQKNESR